MNDTLPLSLTVLSALQRSTQGHLRVTNSPRNSPKVHHPSNNCIALALHPKMATSHPPISNTYISWSHIYAAFRVCLLPVWLDGHKNISISYSSLPRRHNLVCVSGSRLVSAPLRFRSIPSICISPLLRRIYSNIC